MAEAVAYTSHESNGSQPDSKSKKLLDEHHRLHLRVEELEQELDVLKNSPSWKITKPFRSLKSLLGAFPALVFKRSHHIEFNPFHGLRHEDGKYRVTAPGPFFILGSAVGRLPRAWVEVTVDSSLDSFSLYYDTGFGFNEDERIELDFTNNQRICVELPLLLKTLRLDPHNAPDQFSIHSLVFRERFSASVLIGQLLQVFSEFQASDLGLARFIAAFFSAFQTSGFLGLKAFLLNEQLGRKDRQRLYRKWCLRESRELQAVQTTKAQRDPGFTPLLSVLMPVYNTPEKWLRKAIESVLAQDYQNFELIVVDDASTRPSVRMVLTDYEKLDGRVRVVYRSVNGHISAASNTALEHAKGEFCILFDHDDELAKNALSTLVHRLRDDKDLDLIFSDEDRISPEGQRLDPYFKQGWDPELLLSQNVISHLALYRTQIAQSVKFREGYEGSQDWDFALRFVEQCRPDKIAHVPGILYHWRLIPGAVSFTVETKGGAFSTGKKAVSDALHRRGRNASVVQDSKTGFLQVRTVNGSDLSFLKVPESLWKQAAWDWRQVQDLLAESSNELVELLAPGVELTDSDRTSLLSEASSDGIGLVSPKIIAHRKVLSAGLLPTANGILLQSHYGYGAEQSGYVGLGQVRRRAYALWQGCLYCSREKLAAVLEDAEFEELSTSPVSLSLLMRKHGNECMILPFIHASTNIKLSRFVVEPCSKAARLHSDFSEEYYHPFLSKWSGSFLPG